MHTSISDYDLANGFIRTYPWTETEGYPADRYYDFKANPELIAQALNDFKGWSDWSEWDGVQLFYRFLEWLNGPDSQFESTGCGFRGPSRNPQRERWPGEWLSTGGLIFLFRDAELNLSEQSAAWATKPAPVGGTPPPLPPGEKMSWLLRRCHEHLQQINPHFFWGYISVVLFPTFYSELSLEHNDKFGHEIAFRWYAWGNTETETMAHFKEVVATMYECLKRVSAEAQAATK